MTPYIHIFLEFHSVIRVQAHCELANERPENPCLPAPSKSFHTQNLKWNEEDRSMMAGMVNVLQEKELWTKLICAAFIRSWRGCLGRFHECGKKAVVRIGGHEPASGKTILAWSQEVRILGYMLVVLVYDPLSWFVFAQVWKCRPLHMSLNWISDLHVFFISGFRSNELLFPSFQYLWSQTTLSFIWMHFDETGVTPW